MRTIYLIAVFITCSYVCFGQDTSYFDSNWKASSKTSAAYYRVNKKTGNKWERTDYFIKNNHVQMKGLFSSLSP